MTAGLHAAGNPHVHVMLCQRATGNAPEPDFFKRKTQKPPDERAVLVR